MSKYILRRVIQVIPTMLGVFTVLFTLTYLMPGDPLRAVLGEQYKKLSEEVIEGYKEQMGLNDPFHERYVEFLGRAIRLDFGKSDILGDSVNNIIGYRFPRTLQLMFGGIIVAMLIGIPAGIIAAERQYTWVDHTLMVVSLIGVSVPVFWLALLAQMFLTTDRYGIALFPVAGYENGNLVNMLLPSLVLGTALSATIARVTRAAMLEVRSQDFIRTAHAKGLPYRTVLMRHQFRNSLIPIITVIALDIGYLLGGSIVTETIFNWPGLGRAIVPAIERRDTPVILGILVFGSFLFIIINLITDLIYALVNPRIRFS
jgi:peptide/nickel transport system permease protein